MTLGGEEGEGGCHWHRGSREVNKETSSWIDNPQTCILGTQVECCGIDDVAIPTYDLMIGSVTCDVLLVNERTANLNECQTGR